MAAGFPTKANFATGDVLSATNMNDLAGTVNLINPSAKGDLYAGSAANTYTKLSVGANNTVLTADSTTATGLKWATPAAGGGGKVLQVVYSETSADTTISTLTPTSIGNTATITPTLNTSKILVLTTFIHELKVTTGTNNSLYAGFKLVRGATVLQATNQDGGVQMNLGSAAGYTFRTSTSMNYLDSPATTSATTYTNQAFCDPTWTIRFGFDNAYSSMVLMEIGA